MINNFYNQKVISFISDSLTTLLHGGSGKISRVRTKGLIGKHIYLQRKQAEPSWHGGTILSYYPAEYQGKNRMVFIYKPALTQKVKRARKPRWGPYVEKLITDDGIHLLHKDPKGLGLWGRSQMGNEFADNLRFGSFSRVAGWPA